MQKLTKKCHAKLGKVIALMYALKAVNGSWEISTNYIWSASVEVYSQTCLDKLQSQAPACLAWLLLGIT